jgi:hypothetical protein
MPSEVLLLGIAQMAVVIAGFTAVTSVLAPPGGAWSPALRIRHRAIVSTSFNVMFEALVPLIVFAWLTDARTSLVLSSAVVAVYAACIVALRMPQFFRSGAIHTRSGKLLVVMGPAAVLLFGANALVFGSVAVYALALCVQLSVAAVSFYTLVAAALS